MKEKSDLMATRIGLESYEVMATHGVFDYEKQERQPFIISIWATLENDVEGDVYEYESYEYEYENDYNDGTMCDFYAVKPDLPNNCNCVPESQCGNTA